MPAGSAPAATVARTESINRSWTSASVASSARSGTSRDICTANDSNSDHDERASNTPGSTVSVRVVVDTGWRLLTRVDQSPAVLQDQEGRST